MQGRLAVVGRQIHRELVLFYQDLKAGKLASLRCEVDGCEALRSGVESAGEGSAGLGRGPQPCLCLGVALFVPCVAGGAGSQSFILHPPTSLLPNGPSMDG